MKNNLQIERIARTNSIPFIGVFSKDYLHKVPKISQKSGMVVNMSNLLDSNGNFLPGSHWVSLWIEDGETIFYFDPFGINPAIEIESYMNQYKKKYYNTEQIQSIRSEVCGDYAMSFLLFMTRHSKKIPNAKERFERFLHLFKTNPNKNEEILKSHINWSL
jgi:hypothetical protein